MMKRVPPRNNTLAADRDGATAVEFALITPLFMVLVYLIIDIGYFFYCGSVVDNAVYFLSRDVIAQPSASRTLAWARSQFAIELAAAGFSQVDATFVLYVQPLSTVDPSLPAPTTDTFSITAQTPTVVRIVYPRSALLGTLPIDGPWTTILNRSIDSTAVIVPR